MTKWLIAAGAIVVVEIFTTAAALAGPWEDGMAAYNRGDYVPATHLFRALAAAGNAKAQRLLGVMYRKGQGVRSSPTHAHMWFGFAAAHGEPEAAAELRETARTMTPEQLAHARAMSQHCEASHYRTCEY
jgi:TPR repeat protein